MANLNLSEFTEKLFVADADHTFIWDSAALISKRVSRNSWLNSGTLTSDAPVTISQTWNGTGSTVFKALVVNATTPGTTSSGDSLVADFQVGGVSQLRVHKSGGIGLNNLMAIGGISGPWFMVYNGSTPSGYAFGVNTAGRLSLPNTGTLEWASFASGTPNTLLVRDDADNTLALRNGAAAQTFNVYGTYTSGTSYERLTLSAPSAANAIIGTNKGSGGGTARGLDLHTDGAARMTITTAGNVGIGTTSPTSKLHVVGDARITTDVLASAVYGFAGANTTCGINGSDGVGPIIHANQNGKIGFFSGTSFSGVMDTVLVRDGETDHLAMRRSTNGQKFSVYGTYPGANWERFTITAPTSGNVLLGTYKGTGGIARGLELQADGTTRMLITAAGAIIQRPLASVTPPDNGDLVIEATSNTTLTFKLKGTDGTVRTGTITLA